MTSRKVVLAKVRKHLNVDSYLTFSDKRKDHQRVKFFGSTLNPQDVRFVLDEYGFKGVTVERVTNWQCLDSLVLRFPYTGYSA